MFYIHVRAFKNVRILSGILRLFWSIRVLWRLRQTQDAGWAAMQRRGKQSQHVQAHPAGPTGHEPRKIRLLDRAGLDALDAAMQLPDGLGLCGEHALAELPV
jgi:hypothetical protein